MYKKILIINPFGIGDVLFTTPLVKNIKAHQPDVYVGYLGNRRTSPLLENNPKIDKVFVYERDEFHEVYKRSKLAFLKKWMDFSDEIKKERFDAVIDLSLNGNMSALTMWLGIPLRLGYNYKNRSPFLTHQIKLEGYESEHVIRYYLKLLEMLKVPVRDERMEISVLEDDQRWAKDILEKSFSPSKKSAVALVPGGGASWGKDALYKRWSAESYAKLADKIVEKTNAVIILMGDQKEIELCRSVAEKMKSSAVVLAGETSVLQMAALFSLCRQVIVNDGGPLHIAVAAGAKTISIFGPVDENVYGPYPRSSDHLVIKKNLPCQPCYRRFRRAQCSHVSCLNSLTVEDVWERMEGVV